MEMLPVTEVGTTNFKWISWPAIFSGTLVALALELLFASFGFFIGFTLSGPSAWGKFWYFVTSFCALLGGSYVAARSSAAATGGGALHGVVTWGLTTVATFAFVLWASWGVVNTSMAAMRNAMIASNTAVTTPATRGEASRIQNEAAEIPVAPQTQYAAIAGHASTLSLVIFGGILCGLVASAIGGNAAKLRFVMRRPPVAPVVS